MDRKLLLFLLLVIGLNIILGYFLQLQIYPLAISIVLSLPFAFLLWKNEKRSSFEKKRFEDANAYMSQVVQSFTSTGRILASLSETRNTFSGAGMYQLLTKAICHIENARDTLLAEEEALEMIEEEYGCERIRVLHDFMRKAEQRGGSYEVEFRLLETIRDAWEKAKTDYRNTVLMIRNTVALEYLVLIWICSFLLKQFPAELSIIHLPLAQGLNGMMIVFFWIVVCKMDKKLTMGLLEDESLMSKEDFENQYHILDIRRLIHKQKVRKEVMKAFPKWLFDILLLIQSENVAVAIFLSIPKAAPVLQEELKSMKYILEDEPSSAEAFMLFLRQYNIPGVENIMRKLYSLSMGTGGNGEVMAVIIDSNLTMLAEGERKKVGTKGQMMSLYYMVPTIPVMIGLAGYGVMLVTVIFQNVLTIL